MKYSRLTIFTVAAILLLVTSCHIETSDNGQLDGFWKLTRVDTLATGGVLDLTDSGLFWSVQKDLISMEDKYETDAVARLFRFSHEGNTLKLSEPRENHQLTGDTEITDVELLKPFGVNQLEETFKVESLNSKHLYLSTDKLRLSFRRF